MTDAVGLRGIAKICTRVRVPSWVSAQFHVDTAALLGEIEREANAARVVVVMSTECDGTLSITLAVSEAYQTPVAAYSVRVQFEEAASTRRHPQPPIFATTWLDEYVGVAANQLVAQNVGVAVGRLANGFFHDLTVANKP